MLAEWGASSPSLGAVVSPGLTPVELGRGWVYPHFSFPCSPVTESRGGFEPPLHRPWPCSSSSSSFSSPVPSD